MTLRKVVTIGLVGVMSIGVVRAAEYKWVGESGNWSDADNWENKQVPPSGSGIAVFEPTNGPIEVNFDLTTNPLIGGFKFKGGSTVISSSSTPTLYIGSTSFGIDVADGAQGMVSNVNLYCYYGGTTCTKTGAGMFTSYGKHFDNGGSSDVKVKGGAFRKIGYGNFNPKSITIDAGAEMVFGGAVQVTKTTAWTISEGANVTLLNGSTGTCGGLMGAGNIEVEAGDAATILYLNTAAATVPYTGKVTGGSLTVELAEKCQASDGKRFVVQTSDQFATCNVRRPGGLSFAAGIGTISLAAVDGYYGAGFSGVSLEDVDGNPILLTAAINNVNGVSFSGCGDFRLTSNATLSGTQYAATGTIGVAGGTLKMSADFDLSQSGNVRGVVCNGGSVEFKGMGHVDVPVNGTLTGSCQFNTKSIRVSDFNVTTPTLFLLGGVTHELAGGESTISTIDQNAGVDSYNVVSGGHYSAPKVAFAYDTVTSLKIPGFIGFSGNNGQASLRMMGGDFYLEGGWGVKHLRLNGGRLHFKSNFTLNPNTTKACIYFDGGDAVAEVRGESFEFEAKSDAYRNYVCAGGLSLRAGRRASTKGTTFYFHNPIQSDPALDGTADGGVTLHDYLTYRFDQPLDIKGPFSFLDGVIWIHANQVAVSATAFGSGDFVMRNALVDLTHERVETGTLRLATGSDSALVYNGGSTFRFRTDASRAYQHVTVSNLRRGGRGAVLTLSELSGCQDKIGAADGDSFTVAGWTSTNYVPAVVIDDADGNYPHFAKYDATLGFQPVADEACVSDVAKAGPNDLFWVNETKNFPTMRIAAAKVGSWSWLSVNAGQTLTIGNGSDPAVILFKAGGGVSGSGKIDFGTSEGVFFPSYARDRKDYAHAVNCVLDGRNGVSYVGADYNNVRRMAISSANVYHGKTMVQGCIVYPRNAQAFSSGVVQVGPGQYRGGRIEFDTDLTLANDFHVGGWGWSQTGAFVFDSDTELSGGVELLTETRVRVTDGHVGKLSGAVSGDRLVVWGNTAGTTGVLALFGANVHTGGTEVVKAVLQVANATALGTGEVLLDGGTLVVANGKAPCTVSNPVKGLGTVRLAGSGVVSFANLKSEDDVGFTLDLAKRRQTISTLAGFKEITSSRSDKVILSVLNDASFSGPVAANVELYFGGEAPKSGMLMIVR